MTAGDILATLGGFGRVLAIKLYRLGLETAQAVPTLPCLDHEAMLHEGIAPHIAAYVEAPTGDLHEVVFVPGESRIEVDTVSTWGEHSPASHAALLAFLQTRFSGFAVRVDGPSWWRAEKRVAKACRAQVSLRDVLLGGDIAAVKLAVDRLQLIGTIMEKHSRVASWGIRTVMSPLLAAAGVGIYVLLGLLDPQATDMTVTTLRYGVIASLGAWFLYYGMKAVQLTDMGNRVWKRSAEYSLILRERERLRAGGRD